MKTVEWDMIVNAMKSDLVRFVNGELSSHNFYKIAVKKGLGGPVRRLVRPGAERARKISREALRRRSVVVVKVPDTITT